MSFRLIGMLAAGLLAGVVLALVGVAFLTAPPTLAPNAAPSPTIDPDQAPPREVPANPVAQSQSGPGLASATESVESVLGGMEDWTYRIPDANNQLLGVVSAATFDPVARGEYRLTEVDATFYPDGRIVRLRADEGTLRGQRDNPESGLLSGNVAVALYPMGATEDDARAFEAGEGDVEPQYTFTTNQMRFDTILGQGVAPGHVTIAGPGLRLDGRGLTLRFGTDTASDEPRLLLVRLDESDGLRLWPDRFPTNDRRANRTRDENDSTAGASPASGEGEAPVESIYALSLEDDVVISRSSYAVRADRLDAHARLFDGELRADAIAPLQLGPEAASADVKTQRATGGVPEAIERDPGSPLDADPPIVVTWNGAFEFTPLLEAPGVLDFDDAAIEFASDAERGVRIGDDLTGVALEARTVTYFATGALFQARAGTPENLVLRAREVASITSSAIDVDLSSSPLMTALVRRPGVVEDAQGRTIRWNRSAEASGLLAGDRLVPTALSLTGGVELRDDSDTAEGDRLAVVFDNEGNATRIDVTGGVRAAQVARDRSITGDSAVIALANSEGQPAITSAEVTGNAWAIDGERTYEADRFTAAFAGDELSTISAEGDVRVSVDERLRLECSELRSDRALRTIDLVGADAPVTVTRTDRGITLVTTVGSARVEEDDERITGFGPGRATLAATGPSSPYRSGELAWGGGFIFDGQAESLELLGGITIEAQRDEDETHSATAQRAEIDLEGLREDATRIAGARLFGGPGPEGQDVPATAEVRRTRIDPDSLDEAGLQTRVLESLLQLSSGELLVDAQAQTVDAPGAGRLVVEDQRPADADSADQETRGTSVFRWAGGMNLLMDEGRATLERDVRVRHAPRTIDEVTQLDCQTLVAYFTDRSVADDAISVTRLLASGSVYAGYRGLEVLADEIEYRAAREQIIASASDSNRVTVFDPERAGHYTASSVLIDLVTGNWTSEGTTGAGGLP